MGFLHENITLAYFVFLGELSFDLFLVKGMFGNFGFLSLLAGFSNRKRASLRTPNIEMESLLITEFRQSGNPTEPWTGLILTTSCPKNGLFREQALLVIFVLN